MHELYLKRLAKPLLPVRLIQGLLQLKPPAFSSVPTAVAHEMKKSPGTRKVLCVVTKLFKVNKEATVKLHQDLQSSAKVSGDKVLTVSKILNTLKF